MDYKYINQLLERYWNCETSLEEEGILRAFFSQKDVPAELRQYQPLFAYQQMEGKAKHLGADFDSKLLAIIHEEEPVKVKARTITRLPNASCRCSKPPLLWPSSSRWAMPRKSRSKRNPLRPQAWQDIIRWRKGRPLPWATRPLSTP